jgi:ClpP class serine protease
MREGVAIIPVAGLTFRYANLFTDISGVSSIESLARDLRLAMESDNVRAIVLDVDSSGGQMTGIGEFAQMVRDASKVKPVATYVGGMDRQLLKSLRSTLVPERGFGV